MLSLDPKPSSIPGNTFALKKGPTVAIFVMELASAEPKISQLSVPKVRIEKAQKAINNKGLAKPIIARDLRFINYRSLVGCIFYEPVHF